MATSNPVRGLHGGILIVGYVLLATMPLVLAYSQGLELRPLRDELSSAMAIVAFSMLLMEFVLSGRFQVISGRVGIDKSMRTHRWVAYLLTLMLLIHPWLYSLPSASAHPLDTPGATALKLTGLAVATGWAAWFLLIVLVAWAALRTIFGYRYETWRICHGLGALVIALLGLHHALTGGRYSAADGLAAFWLGMTAIALLSLIHVYLVRPLMHLRRPYRVTAVENVGLKTWELTIEPDDGTAMAFEAGQFVWLTVNRSPFTIQEHPLSISSCPADRPRMAFTIKEVGDFTKTVGSIPLGSRAYLDGPHGNVVLSRRSAKGIVFIAGGVGVAPIMSILRQARATNERRPMRLVYGNRVVEQILYGQELEDICRDCDLQVVHVLSEPPPGWDGRTGQLDQQTIDACIPTDDREQWLYIVCGPSAMIVSVEKNLAASGVPRRQIVCEKFSYD